MKKVLISILSGLLPLLTLGQSTTEIDRQIQLNLERTRNSPPEQRIAICINSAVSTMAGGFRELKSLRDQSCLVFCQAEHPKEICSQIGGSKWRVQAVSQITVNHSSLDCACSGQQYVLNEIKAAAPEVQLDSRDAELTKREKELADREKALLGAENKRLRDELEAERKKKK
jgi:hypothetical protein